MSVVLIALGIVLACIADCLMKKPNTSPTDLRVVTPSMAVPELPVHTFVTKTHCSLNARQGRLWSLGIDGFLAEALAQVDALELVPDDAVLSQGDVFATLHVSGKRLHLRAPFGGRVVQRNIAALCDPLAIVEDPYESGWLVHMAPVDDVEAMEALLSQSSARCFLAGEYRRLADALNRAVCRGLPLLTDGDSVERGALGRLDQWALDDFEAHFLR